jgi:small subunit ribosomal protein S6
MRYLTLKYDAKMKRHYELKKKGDLPVIFDDVEENDNSDED